MGIDGRDLIGQEQVLGRGAEFIRRSHWLKLPHVGAVDCLVQLDALVILNT